jgi:hypothetical protein
MVMMLEMGEKGFQRLLDAVASWVLLMSNMLLCWLGNRNAR